MASPRKVAARVYLNDEEKRSLRAVMEEMSLTESAAIRWLLIHGLRAVREKGVIQAEPLQEKLSEPGERKQPVDELLPLGPMLELPPFERKFMSIKTVDGDGNVIEEELAG